MGWEAAAVEIRPDFYDRFCCLAQNCRHTCCRGWEIDVDPDTLALYRSVEGPLGGELRAALQERDGEWSIRFNEAGNCPLLRSDGLCRVILELGEDALCDICALHPRFFLDVGKHELSGVGLCCEATVSLLLDEPGELTFLTEDDEPLNLAQLLELLGTSVTPEDLRYTPRIDEGYYRAIFRRYGDCEAIDGEWSRDLAALAARAEELVPLAREYAARCGRAAFDRVFGYILYRQLEELERYGLPALLRYAREGTDFILLWAAAGGDLPERVRRWSVEIEYSTENQALLLEHAQKESI